MTGITEMTKMMGVTWINEITRTTGKTTMNSPDDLVYCDNR